MVEILFWMWVATVVASLLFSSQEHRGENVQVTIALLPAWVFMILPLTMIGWIIEAVRIKT